MGKPRLPKEIEYLFPVEIVREIYRYIPKLPKLTPLSESLQREVQKLQRSPKRNAMDLYGLDDFILC
jgi:hypothetical protein